MAYCTAAEVVSFHPKASTTGFKAEEIDTQNGYFAALIDARIGFRYGVPVSGNPPLLKLANILLTLASLMSRTPAVAEYVDGWKADAAAILDGLSDGTMALLDASGGVVSTRSGTGEAIVVGADYVPTFGVAPSVSERVDPDRGDDEASERFPEDS